MAKVFYKILLKFFLNLYDFAYQKASAFAIRYYGFHPKHKYEDFHKFFLDNIPQEAKVLDIGCSRGELTVDLALKASMVVAYDISREAIETAKKNNLRENIFYFVGEATRDMPGEKFDVVVCSNVLEHFSDPKECLRKLNRIADRLLIRVPNIDNNWIAGVKKDLGMHYYLDPQHHKEYTVTSIQEELEETGWKIEFLKISNEIRVVAKKTT
jgi:2-polyprenyl-3-methyl-5-hydroxy-6-metoxy-1,4-benzoquinol methylase